MQLFEHTARSVGDPCVVCEREHVGLLFDKPVESDLGSGGNGLAGTALLAQAAGYAESGRVGE